jgi:endonuclease/exonuclease/phosphatase family metal-dependent hydrolase
VRVVNFNIHGANVPGKKDRKTQERAWHQLAAWSADLALIQEAEHKAIPDWARDRWEFVVGDPAVLGSPSAGWGSVIAADRRLKVRPRTDLAQSSRADLIYDYVVFAEIELPDARTALVSSVHVPARRLPEHLELMGKAGALRPDEMEKIAQPGDIAWALDLFFSVIASMVSGGPFLVGGDWNNSRLFDLDANLRRKGQLPFGAMFFTRARDAGWYECHGAKNEERSYLKPNSRPHQLDHLFCDKATYGHMQECNVRTEWIAEEISDHAPLVTDFSWD